jgi:hypothetical protein
LKVKPAAWSGARKTIRGARSFNAALADIGGARLQQAWPVHAARVDATYSATSDPSIWGSSPRRSSVWADNLDTAASGGQRRVAAPTVR